MPLKIHFLNVGRGDCTIIEFPSGNLTMVDIDNLKDLDPTTKGGILAEVQKSLGPLAFLMERQKLAEAEAKITDPFEYFEERLGDAHIFRLIITHPDMDHMTGLKRLVRERVLSNFWHSGDHDFNLERWKEGPYDQEDWKTYQRLRESESNPRALVNRAGDRGSYWTQDGIEVLAPTEELVSLAVERELANIISTVLRITYVGRTILLGGDATADESWPAMMQSSEIGEVDVLKASHHGRKTGFYRKAARAMSPWLTITSVGQEEYDATESYRRYSTHTVSLRESGDIRITIQDDGKLLYSPNIESVWEGQIS